MPGVYNLGAYYKIYKGKTIRNFETRRSGHKRSFDRIQLFKSFEE